MAESPILTIFYSYTVYKNSFPLSSVCYKITQTSGGVGVDVACPPKF